MWFRRALLFSFAGHLFCFSFFSFNYGINPGEVTDKLAVAFLGSILQHADLYPQKIGKGKPTDSISYIGTRIAEKDFLEPNNKPQLTPSRISYPKRLNKFLVFEDKHTREGALEGQDKYLATKPAWERVDLKLRIE